MDFGKRLREIRKQRKLTLAQLAKISKVSKAYLSQLENEQFTNPTSEVIVKLSSALGISVNMLLGLEKIPLSISNRPIISVNLRALALEEQLNDADIKMLSNISYKGKQPLTIEGWRSVLQAIRQSVEDTKN